MDEPAKVIDRASIAASSDTLMWVDSANKVASLAASFGKSTVRSPLTLSNIPTRLLDPRSSDILV